MAGDKMTAASKIIAHMKKIPCPNCERGFCDTPGGLCPKCEKEKEREGVQEVLELLNGDADGPARLKAYYLQCQKARSICALFVGLSWLCRV